MRELWRAVRMLSFACVFLAMYGGSARGAQAPKAVNPQAEVLADFKARVDSYMKLHNDLEKKAPPLKETKDPAKIAAAQDGLAAQIRVARKGAKRGEIFTPAISARFRQLMYPEMKGSDGQETKAAIKEDSPGKIPLQINARYPESAPLPTVPPNLLANLPVLPEDLEYRIVNRDLILRDVHANVIVDYIPNAIR